MPTDQQMQGVELDIIHLQTATFKVTFDRVTVDARWNDLPAAARTQFMEEKVVWEGFTLDQRVEVEFRVIAGEPREMWFEEIQFERFIAQAELVHGYEELIENTLMERGIVEKQAQPDALGELLQHLKDHEEIRRMQPPSRERDR